LKRYIQGSWGKNEKIDYKKFFSRIRRGTRSFMFVINN
jgi:hypothetical protein